jgi:hypothetical protein
MKIIHLIRRVRLALSLLPEQSLLPQIQVEGRRERVEGEDTIASLGLVENACVHFSYEKTETTDV